jgi:hypothetical protein
MSFLLVAQQVDAHQATDITLQSASQPATTACEEVRPSLGNTPQTLYANAGLKLPDLA